MSRNIKPKLYELAPHFLNSEDTLLWKSFFHGMFSYRKKSYDKRKARTLDIESGTVKLTSGVCNCLGHQSPKADKDIVVFSLILDVKNKLGSIHCYVFRFSIFQFFLFYTESK